MHLDATMPGELERADHRSGKQVAFFTVATAMLIALLIWLAPTALDAFNEMLARGLSSVSYPAR